jgi:hypothetical protein
MTSLDRIAVWITAIGTVVLVIAELLTLYAQQMH